MELSSEQIMDFLVEWVPNLILALAVLIIGMWLIGWLVNIAKKTMAKRGVDETLRPFLSSILSISLKILLFISIAGLFGIPVASFIAVIGALAFAVGMALQGSLGHLASGILILLFKPYQVGDSVEIGGDKTGVVQAIQVFNTILHTFDNKVIYVPNGLVTSNPITNINELDKRRVDFTFGIGYDDDIDLAKQTIKEVIESCPQILHEENSQIVVSELAGSSVNFATKVWTKTENYWVVYFYMMENIKKEFDAKDIGIPYPQMDVHVNNQDS